MSDSEKAPPKPRRRVLVLIGFAVLSFCGAAAGFWALGSWSESIEAEWKARDARLSIGTPRSVVLEHLGPPESTLTTTAQIPEFSSDLAYVIESRGDCRTIADSFSEYATTQLGLGRTLIGYRTPLPVTKAFVFIFDPEEKLICRIIAGT